MRIEVPSHLETVRFDNLLILPTDTGALPPVVMIFPDWTGRSPIQEAFGEALAELGYAAFCADLYGFGQFGASSEASDALMTPLLGDRSELRRRLLHLSQAIACRPEIDSSKVAAIGFCFGGLCALDLARSGAPVRAVASFHGLLTPSGLEDVSNLTARLAVFHGWSDPMAEPESVFALANELDAAKADWQLHAFGDTMHAFMIPTANAPTQGIQYNPVVAKRAWRLLETFLVDALAPP